MQGNLHTIDKTKRGREGGGEEGWRRHTDFLELALEGGELGRRVFNPVLGDYELGKGRFHLGLVVVGAKDGGEKRSGGGRWPWDGVGRVFCYHSWPVSSSRWMACPLQHTLSSSLQITSSPPCQPRRTPRRGRTLRLRCVAPKRRANGRPNAYLPPGGERVKWRE